MPEMDVARIIVHVSTLLRHFSSDDFVTCSDIPSVS